MAGWPLAPPSTIRTSSTEWCSTPPAARRPTRKSWRASSRCPWQPRRIRPGRPCRRIKWLMADKSKGYDDLVAARQRIYRQPGFVAAMRDIVALQDPQIRARNLLGPDDYGVITAPTLVLWTTHDPTADVSEGRRIASMIPGARFEVMPGCGHWPQYEDAKTFNRLHLDFLLGR
nr:alpha/beta fold hydrolase [Mycobacterium kansasii]